MQKKNTFVAVLAICFGAIIFLTSVLVYSQRRETQSDRISTRKFYVTGKILPDNVLYPMLMIADKTLLSISTGESQIYLRIRMAQDRLISAQKLLEKGEEELALSTMTKSQKYLILACLEYVRNIDTYSPESGKAIYSALRENTQNLKTMQDDFSHIPTDPISDLITESTTLLTELEHKIQK